MAQSPATALCLRRETARKIPREPAPRKRQETSRTYSEFQLLCPQAVQAAYDEVPWTERLTNNREVFLVLLDPGCARLRVWHGRVLVKALLWFAVGRLLTVSSGREFSSIQSIL